MRAHGRHIERNFEITSADYQALYVAQGGYCFVPTCRSTGATKRLAVHHDHKLAAGHDHPIEQGCRLCVVGLACGPCNKDVLGRLGDLPATWRLLADMLENPPAQIVFGNGGTVPERGIQTFIGGRMPRWPMLATEELAYLDLERVFPGTRDAPLPDCFYCRAGYVRGTCGSSHPLALVPADA